MFDAEHYINNVFGERSNSPMDGMFTADYPSYNTCQRCKETDAYCKWYKKNITTCRRCNQSICRDCTAGVYVDEDLIIRDIPDRTVREKVWKEIRQYYIEKNSACFFPYSSRPYGSVFEHLDSLCSECANDKNTKDHAPAEEIFLY